MLDSWSISLARSDEKLDNDRTETLDGCLDFSPGSVIYLSHPRKIAVPSCLIELIRYLLSTMRIDSNEHVTKDVYV